MVDVPIDSTLTAEQIIAKDAALKAIAIDADNAANSFGKLGGPLGMVSSAFKLLDDKVKAAGFTLENMTDITTKQAAQLSLAVSGVVKARDAFASLGGIDTGSLVTFGDQISVIKERLLSGGTAASALKDALINSAIKAGASQGDITKALKGTGTALVDLVANTMKYSDNALKMQNIMIQAAAHTGSLSELYKGAGSNLQNLNSLIGEQENIMAGARTETGVSSTVLDQYYGQLSQIPGALQNMVVNLEGTNTSVNLLSATVQLAVGSGRSYKEVADDMRKATVSYGLSIPQAIDFTARLAEVSAQTGLPMAELHTALMANSEAFKMFADAGEGAVKQSAGISKIMEDYVGSLQKTGLSAGNAISVVQQMTSAVSGLSIAQKAFLSQQTGGPGGLMGGFQIEKMLREGKTSEVFDLVKKQMQQQMGKIVTLEDASKSEQAAQQLQKQMLILQKGPLAQFAKTDQEAYRILEAFKTGKAPLASEKTFGTAEQIEKGKEIKSLSNTPVTEIASMLESLTYKTDIGSLMNIQSTGLTARSGSMEEDTDAQAVMRQGMLDRAKANEQITTMHTSAETMIGGSIKNIGAMMPVFMGAIKIFSDAMLKLGKGEERAAPHQTEGQRIAQKINEKKAEQVKVPPTAQAGKLVDEWMKNGMLNATSASDQVKTALATAPEAVLGANATTAATAAEVAATDAGTNEESSSKIEVVIHDHRAPKVTIGGNTIAKNAAMGSDTTGPGY